jgi:hypothetical protein
MLVIENFALRPESVICPECNTVFATPNIVRMPNMTRESIVEADLHRVLPDPIIRSAFVAICPACIYAWWFSAFAAHYIVPDLVPETPDVELSKKFAHAVLTGRKNGSHSLDRATLALNGCWCSREQHTVAGTLNTPEYVADNTRWLSLAAQELDAALRDQEWEGNRNRYTYMMGEILRQLGDFDTALAYFNLVDRRAMLPKQLVEHQKQMAAAHQSQTVTLPPHLVEEIFLPKPVQQPTYSIPAPPEGSVSRANGFAPARTNGIAASSNGIYPGQISGSPASANGIYPSQTSGSPATSGGIYPSPRNGVPAQTNGTTQSTGTPSSGYLNIPQTISA